MVERKRQTAAEAEAAEQTHDAVTVILEQEKKRKRRARRRARRKRREAEKQHHVAMKQMQQSVEVIKWCVLAISTVMALSLIIGLVVLNEVENEAERIKAEVEEIKGEAEMIREKIRNPLQSIGGAIGQQLDAQVKGLISGDE